MEIAAWAGRCVLMTPHQARRFPERCDFRTSAGFLNGAAERAELGLLGKGPAAVVTDLGILEPDDTGELVLTALHAGATIEDAQARTGWALRAARTVAVTELPTPQELHVLETLDPQGIYLSPEGAA
jgi:glutaconate CoA-transferase subunit B